MCYRPDVKSGQSNCSALQADALLCLQSLITTKANHLLVK